MIFKLRKKFIENIDTNINDLFYFLNHQQSFPKKYFRLKLLFKIFLDLLYCFFTFFLSYKKKYKFIKEILLFLIFMKQPWNHPYVKRNFKSFLQEKRGSGKV